MKEQRLLLLACSEKTLLNERLVVLYLAAHDIKLHALLLSDYYMHAITSSTADPEAMLEVLLACV